MADQIQEVDYYYVTVPDKPGEGVRILNVLHQAGINLLKSGINVTAVQAACAGSWSVRLTALGQAVGSA